MSQTPAVHAAVAWSRDGHDVAHVPQCDGSEPRSVSQPLEAMPSQSAWPARQRTPHAPAVHVAVAKGPAGHTLRHAPQLYGSLAVPTSQPSEATRLQSPKPGSHAVTVHAPDTQPPAEWAPLHTTPQAPQFMRSDRGSISQPSAAFDEQWMNAPEHDDAQMPAMQAGVRFGPDMQDVVHAPQWLASLTTLASQPLAAAWSQSPKPGRHDATLHAPALHPATPLAAAQRVSHAPQCRGSLVVSKHTPPQHAPPVSHACAQDPQCSASVNRSRHAPLQQSVPDGHACTSLQPGTQRCVEHTIEAGQSLSARQSTHACAATSQRRCTTPASFDPAAHSLSSAQPAAQWNVPSQ